LGIRAILAGAPDGIAHADDFTLAFGPRGRGAAGAATTAVALAVASRSALAGSIGT
jgi:hypothetical protein